MEIIPREDFKDARSIPARFSRYDPRSYKFNETEVIVNLKGCSNVRPPAALWCAVYLLLARRRGSYCALIAPDDRAVALHLTDWGLFRILEQGGVSFDKLCVTGERQLDPASTFSVLLPLTRFDNVTDAEDLTNRIHHSLMESRQGVVNLSHVIYETFSELANNAAEHSVSEIGAYGLVLLDISQGDRRFVCGVADGGIGIQTSLMCNPKHQPYGYYEWAAMERATEELVSGTQDSYRGIGLYETVEQMRTPKRFLIIHSGNGIISKGEKLTTRITSTRLFPGTMAYFSIPIMHTKAGADEQ